MTTTGVLAEERSSPPPGPRPLQHVCLPTPATADARSVGRQLGVTQTFGAILAGRGYSADDRTRRFLDPKLAHLTNPSSMAGRAEAIERMTRAIRAHERIVLFGDYDCDGITAVAILTEVIRGLGGEAVPLLAERFAGGYGVSEPAADRILAERPGLLVTCDCGSSDHERLERIGRAGVDVVVIDHHLVPAEPLPAVAFLNPRRPDCPFPFKHLASCGLALSIGAGLRTALNGSFDVRTCLDLVAIGTVADVMPLEGDNRSLVRAGFRQIERAERPGLRALAERASLVLSAGVTSETIAFDLAPRINAPGRLASPQLALDLLLERDPSRARDLAGQIEAARAERRSIQQRMLDEAMAEIDERQFHRDAAIVIGRRGWHAGVVGIVAANVVERTGRIAAVISFDGAVGRGSVRAPKGVPIYDLLVSSREATVSFGGHQAAAGVEVRENDLERFREMFCAAAHEHMKGRTDGAIEPAKAEALLDTADDPYAVVRDMDLLEPCGMGNPLPRVGLRGARVARAQAVRGGHLQLQLALERGHVLYGFGQGLGHRAAEFPLGARVDAIGYLRRDSFRGGSSVAFRIEAVGPSRG